MSTVDQQMDTLQLRRMNREAKFENVISKREDTAEAMVGELCREGKKVYYVSPQGGKYREGTRLELIAFLIRNNYA